MSTGRPFPRGKAWPRRDGDNSLHLLPRLRISRSYIYFHLGVCMAVAGHIYFITTYILVLSINCLTVGLDMESYVNNIAQKMMLCA
jgi:hypothetical protein